MLYVVPPFRSPSFKAGHFNLASLGLVTVLHVYVLI